MSNQTNLEYVTAFFDEKEVPYKMFEFVINDVSCIVEQEAVIESIKAACSNPENSKESDFICDTLRKIDYHNGDVNHFLEHLAKCLAMQNGMVQEG